MINIAERLAAQAQKTQMAPASAISRPEEAAAEPVIEYARAPAASGPQPASGRPPAIQRNSR